MSGLHTAAGHIDDRHYALGLVAELCLLELRGGSRLLHGLLRLLRVLSGGLLRLRGGLLRLCGGLLRQAGVGCHHAGLGGLESAGSGRLGGLVALRILTLRITALGVLSLYARHVALLRVLLAGVLLALRIALLRVLLRVLLAGVLLALRIALLRVLLRVLLAGVLLSLRIALLWVLLAGVLLPLRIALLWVLLALPILALDARHIALRGVALLGGHGLLAPKLVHHLTDDTSQHATTHGTGHRVHAGLAVILALWIALLAVSIGYSGLLGRVNDVLEKSHN